MRRGESGDDDVSAHGAATGPSACLAVGSGSFGPASRVCVRARRERAYNSEQAPECRTQAPGPSYEHGS